MCQRLRLNRTGVLVVVLPVLLVAPSRALVAPAAPTYLMQWGVSGSAPGQFNGPWGCAVDVQGNVYVVDRYNGRVQEFDAAGNLRVTFGGMTGPLYAVVDPLGNLYVPDNYVVNKFAPNGTLLAQWGSQGNGPGQFQAAAGIARDAAGNLYVADYQLNRVQKFTAGGTYVTQWGSTGSGAGQFQNPTGVCTDAGGNVYVADMGNNRVQVLTGSGAYVGQWGMAGTGNGQFANPASICTDALGNFYVGDESNHRVQKFSPSWSYVSQFGSFGTATGQFTNPVGVAADAAGNVFVCDYGNNRLQAFSGAGVAREVAPPGFVTAWGSSGSGPGQFGAYLCVATGKGGSVFVSDRDNSRVHWFRDDGTLLGSWGSAGSGPGQFSTNLGIAVGDSGANYATDLVFVVDAGNSRVHLFNKSGVELLSWSTAAGVNPGKPRHIALDASGHAYLTDYFASAGNRVAEFTASGAFVTQWGSYGSGPGQFSFPEGIAIDPSGNVLVADDSNSRIERFSGSGSLVATWGTFGGNASVPTYAPLGLAIDALGRLFVVDATAHYLGAFSETGVEQGVWVSATGWPSSFSNPTDVAVGRSGDLYVADGGAHQVLKFAQPPIIAQVADVPGDQGGAVTLRILRSSADATGETLPVTRYDVYRRIDPLVAPASSHSTRPPLPAGAQFVGWDLVASIPANGSLEYDAAVPTLENATQSTLYYTAFLVQAVTSNPSTSFSSATAYGYSIDNISPPAPNPFAAAYSGGGTHLHWGASPAPDFATFRVYKGASAGFKPSQANLIVATTDTGYVDAGAAGGWYAVSAVDVNGNESAFTFLGPSQIASAPGAAPAAFALERPWPNPTPAGRLSVRFTLTQAGAARLELLDVTGRTVAVRDVGPLGAGKHSLNLAAGQRLTAGLYFVRLTQGGNKRIARVTVLE